MYYRHLKWWLTCRLVLNAKNGILFMVNKSCAHDYANINKPEKFSANFNIPGICIRSDISPINNHFIFETSLI